MAKRSTAAKRAAKKTGSKRKTGKTAASEKRKRISAPPPPAPPPAPKKPVMAVELKKTTPSAAATTAPSHVLDPEVSRALKRCLADARISETKARAKTILMVSGGLNSTALLANLLEHTDQRLFVHHVRIDPESPHAHAAARAVERIAEHCLDTYRAFEFSTSDFGTPKTGKNGGDTMTVMYVAARIATAIGGGADIVYTGHRTAEMADLAEGASVFSSVFINRKFKPEWLRPMARLRTPSARQRLNVLRSIPPELAGLVWWCQSPVPAAVGFSKCGACDGCEAEAKLAAAAAIKG